MPELKVQGFLGSLGEKKGFAYIMDRTVTGRHGPYSYRRIEIVILRQIMMRHL